MDRKKFLATTCALCATGAVISMLDSCAKSTPVNFTVDLSAPANADLGTVGGSVTSNGVIIVRTSSGYNALSPTCTHQGCTVNYNQASTKFICPCHNGVFDINGNVVSGPPPSALAKFTVTQSGNVLTITG